MPKIKRLLWDIETSPNVVYSWRVGFKINLSPENIIEERAIVCIGYKWQEESRVHSLQWAGRGDDKAMLEKFIPILESADEAVAHYGDKFDLPWVRARAAIHGIPMSPFIKSIDTKAQSSRNFLFNSNKLDYLSKVLGFGGKMKTDYDLWVRVMAGDEAALNYMVKYCKRDVRELEKVYLKLENYNKPKTHVGVLTGGEKWSCPGCGSDNTKRTLDTITGAGTRQARMKCGNCKRIFRTTTRTAAEGAEYRESRVCTQCEHTFPISEFRFLKRAGRFMAECRACESRRNKLYREAA